MTPPGGASRPSAQVSCLIDTAAGVLRVDATRVGIARLVWVGAGPVDDDEMLGLPGDDGPEPAAQGHLTRLSEQLDEYFAGRRREFDVPVDWESAGVGEGFACEVYREIQAVPYGEVASYGQIGMDAGRPRSARQVGRLCSLVPVSFLIPVHRVNRADGGWAAGSGARRRLVEHERRNLDSTGPVALPPV